MDLHDMLAWIVIVKNIYLSVVMMCGFDDIIFVCCVRSVSY
jgi:hypothetical protein